MAKRKIKRLFPGGLRLDVDYTGGKKGFAAVKHGFATGCKMRKPKKTSVLDDIFTPLFWIGGLYALWTYIIVPVANFIDRTGTSIAHFFNNLF